MPNKENVYRENLPDSIPIKSDKTTAEDLIEYIRKNSDIKIVYPKEELISAKERYQVYGKYDTHWNKIGSFIGTICLQRAIDSNFYYDLNNIKIEEKNDRDENDLANFASLNEKLFETTVEVSNFKTEIELTEKKYSNCEEYVSNSQNDKVVLFIGDSFRRNMRQYFSKLYKKVVYVHRDDYTINLMDEVKPDIVIIEAVERLSNTIGKPLF